MTNDVDLAWAAGFFEGEGSVDIKRRPNGGYLIRTVATNCEKAMLVKLVAVLGGGLYPRRDIDSRAKTQKREKWQWEIGADKALKALKLMLPYMSPSSKKRQAELAIEFQEKLIHPHGYSTRITDKEIKLREWYRLEVRRLKHEDEVPVQELIDART